jgi:MFS family permease
MLDLAKEFQQPMEDPGWIVKVLIGSLLILTCFWQWFLLPLALFSLGYIYLIFVNHFRMEEEEKLPEWKDWKDLFVKGFVFLLIGLIYYIIPWFSYSLSNSILMGGVLAKMVGLIFLAGTALLFVAALFFLPMGIAQYTREEKYSAAFNIKSIWDKIMNIGDNYFKITTLSILAIIILYITHLIPVIGLVAASALAFYTSLVFASLFGKICREAWGGEASPSESGPQEEGVS